MPQQSDRTASPSVILVVRRPQSLACGDPCGAPGIDSVAQPGPEAMTPLTVRCDPHLPNKMRQREHRDEATGVLPATFLNEAIRNHPDRRATTVPDAKRESEPPASHHYAGDDFGHADQLHPLAHIGAAICATSAARCQNAGTPPRISQGTIRQNPATAPDFRTVSILNQQRSSFIDAAAVPVGLWATRRVVH
jgi:hypothetical protein